MPAVASVASPALAPAVVIAALGPVASWSDGLVLAAALVAYIAADIAVSTVFARLAFGVPLSFSAGDVWVYGVDLLLAPLGFALGFAADGRPWALAIVFLPLALLLRVFAQERRSRIDQALELSQAYRGTAMLLGDVVETDDAYTGSHSRDVVELALEVGRRMGLGVNSLRDLEFGALLHDVGKIAVPNAIINKPGKLNDEEWAIMKTHTIEGQRMLENVGGVLARVGVIVRASHEDFDGTGYPDGLVGRRDPDRGADLLRLRCLQRDDDRPFVSRRDAARSRDRRTAAVRRLTVRPGGREDARGGAGGGRRDAGRYRRSGARRIERTLDHVSNLEPRSRAGPGPGVHVEEGSSGDPLFSA